MKKLAIAFAVLFGTLLFSVFASAAEPGHIISNSEDWKDVYSAIHYANLKKIPSNFLVSTRHGPILINELSKGANYRILSSKKKAYVINYEGMMKNSGFTSVEEKSYENFNLELIKELPQIKNFVIVGSSYGYSAIAVAPYSVINNAWVFFADKTNIDEIESILNSREVKEVLIYGFVDREVKERLSKYKPEIIDTGDRFEDNIRIVDKYLKIKPMTQVILTNGEFIESEIMSGVEPILFTGKENVPDKIRNYIKSSKIEVGVLIGADLVGAATNIRRSTGISVIVKFARGARNPSGPISGVENLDLFYLPVPIMDLSISSARYNKATSQLEITYKSNSNIPIYFKGTITPKTNEGDLPRVGDVNPIFIAPNDLRTVVYPDIKFTGDELSVYIFTLYGETPASLEKILEASLKVSMVNILDRCEISVESVKYNKPKEKFFVKIKNIGEVDCWVDAELRDVLIDKRKTTIGSVGEIQIKKGKTANVIIEQSMSDEDLKDNSLVNVIAYYGEKEDFLVKVFQGTFELGIEIISFATIGLIILAVIILIVIVFLILLFKKRRDEEEDY